MMILPSRDGSFIAIRYISVKMLLDPTGIYTNTSTPRNGWSDTHLLTYSSNIATSSPIWQGSLQHGSLNGLRKHIMRSRRRFRASWDVSATHYLICISHQKTLQLARRSTLTSTVKYTKISLKRRLDVYMPISA
eukprot:Blabericola_migrator_1__5107@NODE_2640_length_2497_cov_16_718519_g1656_i0_p3_GENE_NODE_2640_length_2497_cov_16_718519_g1656_i0NODE_2640_length_2497_cov_16_718519_g1656_i0_p3_ORF_typecomplete_len134_score0_66zfSAP30/PF13866_6/0_019_NODE_2640_length_2497_cov_16_718519_g1656_i019532354